MKIELRLSIRMFGYSQAVARVQSHFFRVEEGTEFAISDLRLHCIGSLAHWLISLRHSDSEIGDLLYEGSVYLDGRPVCDNSWDEKEALVVCRWDKL